MAINTETNGALSESTWGEFKLGWNVIVASFIGIALGLTALPFYTYGVFAGPLQAEFGWTRAQVQAPLLFQTLGVLMMLPCIAWAGDRFGVRPVALLSMFFYSVVFACFSLMTDNVFIYYALAFILGLAGAGTMPITWTRAINGAFDKRRGLALGLALMGSGATAFFAPGFAVGIVESHGWRGAYLGLSLLPLVIGLPVTFFLFRGNQKAAESGLTQVNVTGSTFYEALRDYRMWIIAVAFLFISFGIGGSIPNLFPLFTGAGFDAASASSILAMIGFAVIFGRIFTGFLLDRFWAPAIAGCLMVLPAIACVLLANHPGNIHVAYTATILIGLAAGAEFDIIAYLASRYFGLRNYNKIYSFLFAAFAIGAAAAPAVFGVMFDISGSYSLILSITAVLFVIGAGMLFFLGRYPEWDK